MIYEAEGLIKSVSEVNAALIDQCRTEVIAKVGEHMEEINKELEAASGDSTLRTTCLAPLERLHQRAQQEESIAHLTQAEHEAVRAFDKALEKIETFVNQPTAKPETANDPPVTKPKPVVKTRCIIKPTELVSTTYLETSEEVEEFLTELRKKLEAAISSGQRIQIR
jgi:hypothetical protein